MNAKEFFAHVAEMRDKEKQFAALVKQYGMKDERTQSMLKHCLLLQYMLDEEIDRVENELLKLGQKPFWK